MLTWENERVAFEHTQNDTVLDITVFTIYATFEVTLLSIKMFTDQSRDTPARLGVVTPHGKVDHFRHPFFYSALRQLAYQANVTG